MSVILNPIQFPNVYLVNIFSDRITYWSACKGKNTAQNQEKIYSIYVNDAVESTFEKNGFNSI